jgi:hypothetical protein
MRTCQRLVATSSERGVGYLLKRNDATCTAHTCHKHIQNEMGNLNNTTTLTRRATTGEMSSVGRKSMHTCMEGT